MQCNRHILGQQLFNLRRGDPHLKAILTKVDSELEIVEKPLGAYSHLSRDFKVGPTIDDLLEKTRMLEKVLMTIKRLHPEFDDAHMYDLMKYS